MGVGGTMEPQTPFTEKIKEVQTRRHIPTNVILFTAKDVHGMGLGKLMFDAN
jgi:hypothetical protein